MRPLASTCALCAALFVSGGGLSTSAPARLAGAHLRRGILWPGPPANNTRAGSLSREDEGPQTPPSSRQVFGPVCKESTLLIGGTRSACAGFWAPDIEYCARLPAGKDREENLRSRLILLQCKRAGPLLIRAVAAVTDSIPDPGHVDLAVQQRLRTDRARGPQFGPLYICGPHQPRCAACIAAMEESLSQKARALCLLQCWLYWPKQVPQRHQRRLQFLRCDGS